MGRISINELSDTLRKQVEINGMSYVKRTTPVPTATNKILIDLPYNKDRDLLIAFKDGTYLAPNTYNVTNDSLYMTNPNGNWNVNNIADMKFDFVILRNLYDTSYITGTTTVNTATNQVAIGLDFDPTKDLLIVFRETVYCDDYVISTDNKYIQNPNGNWNINNIAMPFDFLIIKNMYIASPGVKKSSTITGPTNKVLINLPYNRFTDFLLVFENTIYTNDYNISDDSLYIVNPDVNWNTAGGNMTFDFILIKNIRNENIISQELQDYINTQIAKALK